MPELRLVARKTWAVVNLGIVDWRFPIVVPRLQKKQAGFRACMRLKRVLLKSDHCENARPVSDPAPDDLIAGVVEPALRQNDSGAPTRFEKFEIALNKEDVAPDAAFPSSLAVLCNVVLMNDPAILDVPREGWICKQHVEIEVSVMLPVPRIAVRVLREVAQARFQATRTSSLHILGSSVFAR